MLKILHRSTYKLNDILGTVPWLKEPWAEGFPFDYCSVVEHIAWGQANVHGNLSPSGALYEPLWSGGGHQDLTSGW